MNLIKQHLDVAGAIVAFFVLTWIMKGMGLQQYGIVPLLGAAAAYFLLQKAAHPVPPSTTPIRPPVTPPASGPSSSGRGSGPER